MELTQDKLKAVLSYDPETGLFTRLVRGGPMKVGTIAGSKNKDGYIRINILGEQHFAHRLAWLYVYGFMPDGEIDHKNRKKDDNRFENLREVTRAENMQNRNSYPNKSGFPGVHWSPSCQKWGAEIVTNKVKRRLGFFETPEAASAAYLKAKVSDHPMFQLERGAA